MLPFNRFFVIIYHVIYKLLTILSQEKPVELELDDLAKPENEETRVSVDENPDEGPEESGSRMCAPVDKLLSFIENWFKNTYNENSSLIKISLWALLCGLYIAYVMVACIKNFDKATDLFAISMFALFCFVYWFIKTYCGKWITRNIFGPISNAIKSKWKIFKWYVAYQIIIFFILLQSEIIPKCKRRSSYFDEDLTR